MFEDIKELKKLLDEGVITQEEFEKKKYEILGMESPEDKKLREEIEQARAEKREREVAAAKEKAEQAAEEKQKRAAARRGWFSRNKKKLIAIAVAVALVIAALVVYDALTPKTAFAIYSSDDDSLTFYRDREAPEEGKTYKGKECTVVYEGIEETRYEVDIFDEDSFDNPGWLRDGRCEDVESVSFHDVVKPLSCSGWFAMMTNCSEMDIAKLDTSNVTDMSWMFYKCEALDDLDVSNFKTANVKSFDTMFRALNVSELNLTGFKTSNAETFEWMFEDCENLEELDVSSFDTSNATTLCGMFDGCESLTTLDLSHFDVSNAEDLGWMFCRCRELETIDGIEEWDVSNCRDFEDMFASCSSLELDCSGWDISSSADTDEFSYFASGVTRY